jgi:endogenous inhibitor of DNA gyrase (YacG/DUF329 family)
MIDLGRWMAEDYRVALPEVLDDRSVDSRDGMTGESGRLGETIGSRE